MPKKKKLSGRHIRHLGFTIPGCAEELDVPEGAVRRAVEKGEIEVVLFAGLRQSRRARSNGCAAYSRSQRLPEYRSRSPGRRRGRELTNGRRKPRPAVPKL